MHQYFPKPYQHPGGIVKVDLELSNYATKVDYKGAIGIDVSSLPSKTKMTSLKTKVET